MEKNNFSFLPPTNGDYQPPLNRFIPTLPKGITLQWLKDKIPPGGFVLDPIGSNPYLDIEAARSGYRMIAARNNWVLWLILEMLTTGSKQDEIQHTTNKLLLTRRMNETLAKHIQGVYQTFCFSCGQPIQPEGYIWEKNSSAPFAKVYACEKCGDAGERPITNQDQENLQRLGSFQLHRKRAFQRVLQEGEYEQASIETALDCYLPRALYVIMTLVNTMERMQIGKEEKKRLQAVLLTLFDNANSLWHWPPRETRPLVLALPSRFIEKNLWLYLESAISDWQFSNPPVPITYWPHLPPNSGGICLYNRRIPAEQLIEKFSPGAFVAVFPRPNQAFWTFSALWSGWLWGRKAVNPMRSALARRRYDWHWFTNAIHSLLEPFGEILKPEIPFLGIFPQATPNNTFAVLAGTHTSGFTLYGSAYRQHDELIQFEHKSSHIVKTEKKPQIKKIIADFLSARGEPVDYDRILMTSISQLSLNSQIPSSIENIHEGSFRSIQEEVTAVLNDSNFTVAFESEKKGGSQWWLLDQRGAMPPLSERVEIFIYKQLQDIKITTTVDLDAIISAQFKGDQTPERSLIRACIDSYSYMSGEAGAQLHIRPEDLPSARKLDIEELGNVMSSIALILGYKFEKKGDILLWLDANDKTIYQFYISLQSPTIEMLQTLEEFSDIHQAILFPASRSRLLLARMQDDPRLAGYNQRGIHLLKFRHLRWLARREGLDLDMWTDLIENDPPLWDPPEQLQMI